MYPNEDMPTAAVGRLMQKQQPDAYAPPSRGAAVAERQTVTGLLERQGDLIAGAHNMVSNLETRLSLMLAPMPAAAEREGNKRIEPVSITERLALHNYAIESLIARVQQLEIRVEL